MTYQPYGDPNAFRREAHELKRTAETLGEYASRLDRQVAATEIEGPFATRFRDGMQTRRMYALKSAGDLQELANYLLRRAATIEDQNVAAAGGVG